MSSLIFITIRIPQNELGSTCLEILAAVMLSCLAFILAVPALHSTAFNTVRLIRQNSTHSRAALIEATFERAIDKSRVNSVIPAIRLQSPGIICARDGSLHPVLTGPLKFQPDLDSTPLTFVTLMPLLSLRIIDRRISTETPDSISAVLCPIDPSIGPAERTLLKESSHWLALSIDGTTEVTGKLAAAAHEQRCGNAPSFHADLHVVPSSMFTTDSDYSPADLPVLRSADIIANSLLLVALDDGYSLYLDRLGTIRRLSHITSENQPVAYDVRILDMTSVENLPFGHLLSIEVGLASSASKPRLRRPCHYFLERSPENRLNILF